VTHTYTTKREKNGAALQLCKIGGSRYLRIVRASDGKIAARWDGAPFSGKLADAYAAFDAVMDRPMPEGDDFTADDMAFGERLGQMLKRTSPTSYEVRPAA
jgi:hypothetical protein